jgi:hypothetical protein
MLPTTVITRDSRGSKLRTAALAACAVGGVLLCASNLSNDIHDIQPPAMALSAADRPRGWDTAEIEPSRPRGWDTMIDDRGDGGIASDREIAERYAGHDHDERDDRGDGGGASDREIAERYAGHDHDDRDDRGDGGGGKASDREISDRYAAEEDTRRREPVADTRRREPAVDTRRREPAVDTRRREPAVDTRKKERWTPPATRAPTENACAKAFAEFKVCMADAGKTKKGKAARQACKATKRAACK